MFKRILIVTDLSKNSASLISCLKGLKSFGTEEMLLLVCLGQVDASTAVLQYADDDLKKYVENQRQMLVGQGYDAEAKILVDATFDEINRIADDGNYDAIVVGALKRTFTDRIMFNDLAYEIIAQTHKPILLIRLEKNDKNELPDIETIGNHIMFPTDFSENAEDAFEYVVDAAGTMANKVTIVHVQDESGFSPYLSQQLRKFDVHMNQHLQDLEKRLSHKENVTVDTVVKYGSPTGVMLDLIDELQVHLVIMGRQGRGFIKDLFLGSVSNNICRLSSASVLLIPSKQERK
jgi:nucleotide-binding universal stress UspA family protein